jgi:hypothetical protein
VDALPKGLLGSQKSMVATEHIASFAEFVFPAGFHQRVAPGQYYQHLLTFAGKSVQCRAACEPEGAKLKGRGHTWCHQNCLSLALLPGVGYPELHDLPRP